MTQNISSPARVKRTARKGKGEASASAPLTITKVAPQMKVVTTRRISAFVRGLKPENLVSEAMENITGSSCLPMTIRVSESRQ
jgi:hypothetical protein